MPNQIQQPVIDASDPLRNFIGSIPPAQEIRARITRNSRENILLRRLLRVAEAASVTTKRERATCQ
jgi:hypothetical protein